MAYGGRGAVIIIEGSDHLGKTTYSQKVQKNGFKYRHMSKPEPDFDYRSYSWGGNYVFDRHFLGGYVYGYVLELHPVVPDFTDAFRMNCDLLKSSKSQLVIIYTTDLSWYSDHLDKGKPEMFNKEQIMAANDVFRWLAQHYLARRSLAIDIRNGKFYNAH
jgi:hypothetical protein